MNNLELIEELNNRLEQNSKIQRELGEIRATLIVNARRHNWKIDESKSTLNILISVLTELLD